MTKEVYQKSVDILLDAYNAGNLFHGKCDACAVGNILGGNDWVAVIGAFDSGFGKRFYDFKEHYNETEGLKLIDKSGLTKKELMHIEEAFETADDEDGEQFKGLCAVLDVMKDMVEEDVPHKENIEKLESIHEKVKL